MAEYASVSLNILKYPWKYLNKLFWLCQGSEYAWSSCMLNRLLIMLWVLYMTRLYMLWFCSVANMSDMAQPVSIMPELNMPQYTSMFLSTREHGWKLLNGPWYAWKCMNKLFLLYQSSCYAICFTIFNIWQGFEFNAWGIKYVGVVNMLWYSYNIIIIVTVIILQFLCACFVHPGTPQLTVVSFDIFFYCFYHFIF